MAPRGVPVVDVTFAIDFNGVLNVSARDRATWRQSEITITNHGGRLHKDGGGRAHGAGGQEVQGEEEGGLDELILQLDLYVVAETDRTVLQWPATRHAPRVLIT
ncbi:hypothetical protein ACP4OV_002666 [Aristida adscensionis]